MKTSVCNSYYSFLIVSDENQSKIDYLFMDCSLHFRSVWISFFNDDIQ